MGIFNGNCLGDANTSKCVLRGFFEAASNNPILFVEVSFC